MDEPGAELEDYEAAVSAAAARLQDDLNQELIESGQVPMPSLAETLSYIDQVEAYEAPLRAKVEAHREVWGDAFAKLFEPGAVLPFVDSSTGEHIGQAMVISADSNGIALLGDPLPPTP